MKTHWESALPWLLPEKWSRQRKILSLWVILVSQRLCCFAFTHKGYAILPLLPFLFHSAAANWPSPNAFLTSQSTRQRHGAKTRVLCPGLNHTWRHDSSSTKITVSSDTLKIVWLHTSFVFCSGNTWSVACWTTINLERFRVWNVKSASFLHQESKM